MAIRGGAVGVVALSLACALTAPTVRAQVLNGLSLVEYTRDWDGRTENYYAIGDAALVRGLEEADAYFSFLPAYFARDFLDEFVPIELKRWNNRAAKALMARIATGFYSAADPGTDLVPTGIEGRDRATCISDSDQINCPTALRTKNTANLRFPFYAARLLEWTGDDANLVSDAQALADATTVYFSPDQGNGLLALIDVTTGELPEPEEDDPPPPPEGYPMLATNIGCLLSGMGSLTKLLGDPTYWSWASARLSWLYLNRPVAGLDLFADVYTSQGWWDENEEYATLSDTDTLYLMRLAYDGARSASDHAAMANSEKVGWYWYRHGWLSDFGHSTRKIQYSDGEPWGEPRIYDDGKQNYLYMLSHLYRMTGHPAIIDRMIAMWQTFLANEVEGLLVYELNAGQGNGVAEKNQAIMLDALVDAYQATGSTQLLEFAQDFAAELESWHREPKDWAGRPFLRVAESTYGSIGRLEVNFPLAVTDGVVSISKNGVPVSSALFLPHESAVIYLPPAEYRIELFSAAGGTRSASVLVTSAGVAVEYLLDAGASKVQGYVLRDNNDNAVPDLGDTASTGSKAFIDTNNNSLLDVGEPNSLVSAAGFYSIAVSPGGSLRSVRATTTGSATGRWTVGSASFRFQTSGLAVTAPPLSWTTRNRISGYAFHDVNGNGTLNSGEPRLTETIAFIDRNGDGKRNLGEPFAATDTSGMYSIGNLGSGGILRVVPRSGLPTVTFPSSGSYPVVISGTGQSITRSFGQRCSVSGGCGG